LGFGVLEALALERSRCLLSGSDAARSDEDDLDSLRFALDRCLCALGREEPGLDGSAKLRGELVKPSAESRNVDMLEG